MTVKKRPFVRIHLCELEDRWNPGTVDLLKDINVTASSANPGQLTAVGTDLFFVATDRINGTALWKSDANGTVLVKDIHPSANEDSNLFTGLTNVNGTLYFSANDGVNRYELWKSDGTNAGTVLVRDINPSSTASPRYLTDVNGTLFFTADDGVNGRELWKSDGTSAGTVLVKDINPGSGDSQPIDLTDVNGTLFFTADDGVGGVELWKSDGTTEGTVLVRDINPSSTASPRYLTNVNGTLYFSANDGVSGFELWKSDGTTEGTVLVKDINPGSSFSFPLWLTNVSGTLFFSANDGVGGVELWTSDGTTVGTVRVKNIVPGSTGSQPSNLTNVNGTLYFTANDGVNGRELWKSNGTSAGTVLVKDINPNNVYSNHRYMTNVNGTLFFRASDGANGYELWKSDGTNAGTVLVKDIRPGSVGSQPFNPTNVNGTLFFTADNGVNSYELWKSDGTNAGTILVKDIFVPDFSPSSPRYLTNVNGTLFFSAYDNVSSRELWKSDGTTVGTVLVKDIFPGSASDPSNLRNVNGTLFFTANDGVNGVELWKSDGTTEGTLLVRDINPGSSSSSPSNLTNVNGTLFFRASDGVNGDELWKSDGTTEGTLLVRDINPGSSHSSPQRLTNVNGTLFFSVYDDVNGRELWKSDGTSAGTVLVKDINPGSGGSQAYNLTNVNGTLFFSANDGVNGFELWKSDGTSAGTVRVRDIIPGFSSSYPRFLTNVNGTLFFTANHPVIGRELWKSDGTSAGTVLVSDIFPDESSSDPSSLTNVSGTLFFTADNGINGVEFWKSDGTSDGTLMVADILAGSSSSSPVPFGLLGNQLILAATTEEYGRELMTHSLDTGNFDVSLDNSQLAENQPAGTVVGALSNTSADPGGCVYTLVGGADIASFAIVGNTLQALASFDHESKSQYSIRVRATDTGGQFVEKTFTITVTNVNESPVIAGLNPSSIEEHKPVGTVVGSVTVLDPDVGDVHTFAIVGGADAASFSINGSNGQLTASESFDLAVKSAYFVTIRVTDSAGNFASQTFEIQVVAEGTNTNNPPTLDPISDLTILEDGGSQSLTLTGISPGAGEPGQTIQSVTAVSDSPGVVPNPSVSGSGSTRTLTFAPVADANGTATITVTVTDSEGGTNTRIFHVTVNPVNDAPVFVAIPNLAIDENAGLQTVPLNGISPGPTNESAQTISFGVSSSNTALIPTPVVTGSGVNRSLAFTPAANATGTATITVTATDNGGVANGGSNSFISTFVVTVNAGAGNHAPVLLDDAQLPSILRGDTNPPGRQTGLLLAGLVSDPDPQASLAGVAVVGNQASPANQGRWQYSTDGGSAWFDIGVVADNPTALALSESTLIRFLPLPAFDGTPLPLTVRALDNTYPGPFTAGAGRQLADVTTNGGVTPVSGNVKAIRTSVSSGIGFAVTAGGPGADQGKSVATDVAGNTYVAGSFEDTATFETTTLTSAGGADAFVAKYDAEGSLVWAKSLGGAADDSASGVAVDGQGNVVVVGSFQATADLNPGAGASNLTSAGNRDAFVVKLDPDGNFVWAKQFGGAGDDTGADAAIDSQNNISAVGTFTGAATIGGTAFADTGGGSDVFVVKLNPAGNVAAATRQIGGTGAVSVTGVAVGAGGVFLSGIFTGTADFNTDPGGQFPLTSPGTASSDGFVVRIKADNSFEWARQVGGFTDDSVEGVALDPLGNVLITGGFQGTVDFDPETGFKNLSTPGNFDSDAYVCNLDAAGNLIWAGQIGGVGFQKGTGIVVDSRGYVYVAGEFRGTTDFDPDEDKSFNLTNAGLNDVFVTKLDAEGRYVLASQLGGPQAFMSASAVAVRGQGEIRTIGTLSGTADFDPGSGTFPLTGDGADVFVSRLREFAIQGHVWGDLNGNGVREAGEPALTTATVELFDTVDGIANNGNDASAGILPATTGEYQVIDPPESPGYYVRITMPSGGVSGSSLPGYQVSPPGQGADPLRDSDLNSAGQTPVVRRGQQPPTDLGAGFREAPLVMGGWGTGGGGLDESRGIWRDPAGNIYTAGVFEQTIDADPRPEVTNLVSAGGADGFVARYDASGKLAWSRRLGGVSRDEAVGVTTDANGNVFVTGTFEGKADFGPGSTSLTSRPSGVAGTPGRDVFVLKLTADGGFVWARQLGGAKPETVSGIAADQNGNVFTLGTFSGTADFDPDPAKPFNLTSALKTIAGKPPSRDLFVSKLTGDGKFAWARKIGGVEDDTAGGVALDAAGNVYFNGNLPGSADLDPGTGTNLLSGGFVSRFDNSGKYAWANARAGSSVTAIAVSGGYVYSTGTGLLKQKNLDGADVWSRPFGQGTHTAIAVDGTGNVYSAGLFTGTNDFDPDPVSQFPMTSSGGTDAFVSKFDPSGVFLFANKIGDTGDDASRAVAVDGEGEVVVTGSFRAKPDFDIGPGVQNIQSAGALDAFVWKLPRGGINGRIWNDVDGNGLREPNEADTGGVVVELYRSADGVVGNGDDTLVGSQISGANGNYHFADVAAATGYYLRVRPPVVPGLAFTTPDQGGNDDLDSDVSGLGVSPLFATDAALPTSLDVGLTGLIPPFGFAWTTAGPGESKTLATAADPAGNLYVTGEFKGTVDFDPGSVTANLVSTGNSKNAFVAKYTSAGILLWARPFLGTDDVGGLGVAVDAAGNAYVTGRFKGVADFDPGAAVAAKTAAGYDVFVTKLDPAGNFVWVRKFGGSGNDFGNGISTNTSRVLVTGSFQGTAEFGPTAGVASVASFGAQDVFVSSLTADGDLVWVRRAGGGGGDDVGRGITADASGAVLVTGSFSGTADFDPGVAVLDQTSHGQRDAFVWKLDADGSAAWASQAGGPGNDDANAVTVDSAGVVFVTGAFTGTADFDPGAGLLELTSAGSSDVFVWRLAPAGAVEWARRFGGAASEAGNAVAVDAAGVYVAGTFQQTADFDPGAGSLLLTSEGGTDAFAAKLDKGGNRQWAHRLGGAKNDAAVGVVADAASQVTFSGGLIEFGSFDPGDGDQVLPGGGLDNYFVARVSQTLAGEAFPLDSYEPNNTAVTAVDLGVINLQQVVDRLSISSVLDSDWFRFNLLSVGEPGNLARVDFAPGSGAVQLELRRAGDANFLRSSVDGVISLADLPADTYHLRVFGEANPDGKVTVKVPKGFSPDAQEPNNGFPDRKDLGILQTTTSLTGLSVNTSADTDWFAFEIQDVGNLSSEARIDFRNAQGDLELDLFGPGGNLLRSSAGVSDSESVSLAGLPAGQYAVKVFGRDRAINPSYSLTVKPPRPLIPDERETPPNNTKAAASLLGLVSGEQTWENLSVDTPTDQDWFKFSIAAPGLAGHLAAVEFVHAEGDLDLELYDDAGLLAASKGNGDGERISLQGLPAGTYHLRVSGFAGAVQPSYRLRIVAPLTAIQPDRLEGAGGNERRQSASVLRTPGKTKLEGFQALVDLNLQSATDEDWFQFTTIGKGTVQHGLTLTHPAANGKLGLELYNAAGKKVGAGVGAAGSVVVSLKNLPANTYYARVFVPKGGSLGSDYELRFDTPVAATATPDDWTVLVYMTADSLTDRAFNDVNEMEAAVSGLPGSVNLAVMWDQSSSLKTYPTGNGKQPAWGTAGRALIAPDTNPDQVATTFEILPEQNTGDPATLTKFVEWAKQYAPAHHYALVFWDHGGGLRGFNFDTRDGKAPDNLTAGEVVRALGGPLAEANKFDLIAFDACFMGVAEVAYNLGDVAKLVVASQDAVPGDGFEYDTAFSALKTNPAGVTGEQLATGLVRSYAARYGAPGSNDTLSAVRAGGLGALATALGTFSTAVHDALAAAPDDVRRLVGHAASTLLPNESAPEQRDLGGFLAAVVADATLAPALHDAADGALTAFAAAVVSRTSDLRGHSGLSAYLPVSDLTHLTIDPAAFSGYPEEYTAFNAAARWLALLTDLRDASAARPNDADSDDKAAANGNLPTATDLRLLPAAGLSKSGLSLHTVDDEDWYRFQVNAEAGSSLAVDLRVGTAGRVLNADLTDGANNVLASAIGNRLLLPAVPGGLQTYYLHLYSDTTVDSYGFTVNPPTTGTDRSGDNSSPEKTYELEPQAGNVYSGFSVAANSRDWVRFPTTTLVTAEVRQLTLTASGAVTAEIRDHAGNVVTSAAGTGSLVLPYTQYGAARSNVLVITNANGTPVSYGLRFEPGTASAAGRPLDRFDRTEALGTNANWSVAGAISADGNRAVVAGPAVGQALWKGFVKADVGTQVRFLLPAAGSPSVSVLARANVVNDKLTAYEARLVRTGGTLTAKLYRTVNGGTSAPVATAKVTNRVEGVLRLEAQGQFLRILLDGNPCLEFADQQLLPEGHVGFAGTPGTAFDDFQASAVSLALPLTYDAGAAGLGDAWQALAGQFTFQNGQFRSGGAPAAAAYSPARLADVAVAASYSVQSPGQYVGLIARDTGGAKRSHYEARVSQTLTAGVVRNTLTLTRFVNGAAKVLLSLPAKGATAPVVPATGKLGMKLRGNEIQLLIDDAPFGDPVRDASLPLPGRVGISAAGAMAVSGLSVTALPPTFADGFDRDPADDSLGNDWQKKTGNQRITNRRLTGAIDGRALVSSHSVVNPSLSAGVDLSSAGQHTVGLVARHTGPGSYYEARLTGNADGTLTAALIRVVNGEEKSLKSAKFKSTVGVLRFDLEGSNLKLSLYGETLSVTDTTLTGSGLTGVHLGAGDTVDNYLVR